MKTLVLGLALLGVTGAYGQERPKVLYTAQTVDVGEMQFFDAPCTDKGVASHLAPGFPLNELKAGQSVVDGKPQHRFCWLKDEDDDLIWMWDNGNGSFAPESHPAVKKHEVF